MQMEIPRTREPEERVCEHQNNNERVHKIMCFKQTRVVNMMQLSVQNSSLLLCVFCSQASSNEAQRGELSRIVSHPCPGANSDTAQTAVTVLTVQLQFIVLKPAWMTVIGALSVHLPLRPLEDCLPVFDIVICVDSQLARVKTQFATAIIPTCIQQEVAVMVSSLHFFILSSCIGSHYLLLQGPSCGDSHVPNGAETLCPSAASALFADSAGFVLSQQST